MFNLYKYINETTIKEATNPLYENKEIEGRVVPVVVISPTEEILRSYGYKDVVAGRVIEEAPAGKYIVTTYLDGENITKNEDLADKEVITEEKPTEELDEYYMWVACTYETATQIIHTWVAEAKPIEGEESEYNEQTQYLTWEDEVLEEKVIRTYTVNEKTIVNDPDPELPADYEENAQWYSLQDYTDYSHATEIHKGKKYVLDTERKHIDNLTATKRVIVLMLEELGISYYDQLLPVIQQNKSVQLEWELCSVLMRGNAFINSVGAMFSLTPEQLDLIFKVANDEATVSELRETKAE